MTHWNLPLLLERGAARTTRSNDGRQQFWPAILPFPGDVAAHDLAAVVPIVMAMPTTNVLVRKTVPSALAQNLPNNLTACAGIAGKYVAFISFGRRHRLVIIQPLMKSTRLIAPVGFAISSPTWCGKANLRYGSAYYGGFYAHCNVIPAICHRFDRILRADVRRLNCACSSIITPQW